MSCKPFGLYDDAQIEKKISDATSSIGGNAGTEMLEVGHGLTVGLAVRRDTAASSGWAPATGNATASAIALGSFVAMAPGNYMAPAHGFIVERTYYRDPDNGQPTEDDGNGTRQALFQTPDIDHLHVLIQMGNSN